MTYEDLKRHFLGMSENEVADVGRKAFADIIDFFDSIGERKAGFGFAASIIANIVASDNKMSNEECSLFIYMMNNPELKPEEVFKVLKAFLGDIYINKVFEIIKDVEKLKPMVCALALATAVIDGNIDYAENALIKRFLD